MIKPTDPERARILIVDDCPDSAALLADLLALQGYQGVHVTTDAAVVADLHELNAYDLILLDMHMPYLSGLNIMAHRMRQEDTVARIGGNAFLIVLPHIKDLTAAARPAQEILYQLSRPVPVRDTALAITASIGIAIWPLDAELPEQLVLRADQALYEAKRAGGNQYRYANPAAMSTAHVKRDMQVF